MSKWLGNPVRDLPKPTNLKKKKRDSYLEGRDDGEWLTWESQQKVAERKFIHKDWLNLPFGFEGTKNLIMKINDQINKSRRYNMLRKLDKKEMHFSQVNFDFLSPGMDWGRKAAFSADMSGTICLMWQVGLGGTWCIVSRYGVIEGPEVKIRKSHEWRLRDGLMIGLVWFLPKSIRAPGRGRSMNKIMKGKTIWDWDDVTIEIWGRAAKKPFDKRVGIDLGDEQWLSLAEFEGLVKVGGKDIIPHDMCDNNIEHMDWWIAEQVNNGKNVGIMGKDGFRYHTVTTAEKLGPEDYDKLFEKTRTN